ncbi:hypothetical protein F5Y11DRAFT_363359 [Daldinia sp. FL1419]|nr:hypothetical protein F5Y11DRAFT_363359 [Daldinia sp. FL1419]
MSLRGELSPKAMLYFQLKADKIATEPVWPCSLCDSRYRLQCTHLSTEDYATLKAKRNKAAAKDANSQDIVDIYECGHVYGDWHHTGHDGNETRKYYKGMCTECLCEWVWENRSIRVGKLKGDVRARQSRSKVATKSRRKREGVMKKWVLRGAMRGKA